MSYLENVPLDQLEAHPRNVRHDLGDLTELAASIAGMGLLEPIVVAPKGKPGEGFLVIGGHRRVAAARLAGLDKVACILRADLTTQASQIEAMLTENLQRSDLTLMEEADAYAQLEFLGVKDAAIAKTTGRAVRTVKDRRALAGLPTERREAVEAGHLSVEAGVKIAHLREKWAEDSQILGEIDRAAVWAFGAGNYGIQHTIERILEDRRPKPEAEPVEDVDDEDDDGQTTTDWEIRNQERAKRNAAINASIERTDAWLHARIASDPETLADQLMRFSVAAMAEADSEHPVLLALGAPELGLDDDETDFVVTLLAAVNAWPIERVRLAVALAEADVLDVATWGYVRELAGMVEHLGYVPTADDLQLLAGDE